MRLSLFLPIYLGLMLSVAFLHPAPGTYAPATDSLTALDRFPNCVIVWGIANGWYADGDTFELRRTRFPLVRDDLAYDVGRYQGYQLWRPTKGDSFEILRHHEPALRFPRSLSAPVVGRVYTHYYPSLIHAFLEEPGPVRAVPVDCPRSGRVQ